MIDLFAASSSTLHVEEGTFSAASVAADGARLASALAERGLVRGAHVAVWAANGHAYLRTIAALAVGGQVLVSINTRFSAEEAWSIIGRSGARLLITDRVINQPAPGVDGASEVEIVQTSTLDELLANATALRHVGTSDDPFLVFTTSGTTSLPKLVLHTQRSIVAHAADIPGRFGFDSDSRILVALPLCGAFGFAGLIGGLAAGAQIWLPSHFDAVETSALVEQQKITAMNGSDDMYHRMLATGRDFSAVETAGYARFNSSLTGIVAEAEQYGLRLTGLYGMSEVQAMYSSQDSSAPVDEREPGGGFLTSSEAAARVVNPVTGETLAVGHDGELQLRGPSLFSGYLAEGGQRIDPAVTDDSHQTEPDGTRWFRTGDLGRMEPNGSFTYLSRIGDVLRLGGFLVSPAEIEDALVSCAGVAEAQVVAVGRPEGVRPVAVVIADSPAGVDEAKVIEECGQSLARFKTPIRVIEVAEFPTTASANGTKIQRNKIQQIAEAALNN